MNQLAIPLISLFIDLFRRRRVIREQVVPLVDMAARDTLDHAARREAVVSILVGRGMPESDARLLTEAGVKLWKKLQAKAAKKAAKAQRRKGEP